MIEISILIAAIAFAILVIFLIIFLVSLQKNLNNLSQVLSRLEVDFRLLMKDSQMLLDKTTKVVGNVDEKIDNFDPLLKSVSNLGEYTEHITASLSSPDYYERGYRKKKV